MLLSIQQVLCVRDLVKIDQEFLKKDKKVLYKQLANGEDIGLLEKSITGKPFSLLFTYHVLLFYKTIILSIK